jgi:hypothetical protein
MSAAAKREAVNPVETALFGTTAAVSATHGFYGAVGKHRCGLTRE